MPTQRMDMIGDQYAADLSKMGAYTGMGTPHVGIVQLQNWFRTWATTTETARQKIRRDYEYAEGNGKQWNPRDRQAVLKQGRPALELNQILPQVEFICGMQRDMEVDFKTYPRSFNDIRLSEIASATLRASMDFTRVHRTNDRVFDDGTICGLGVWEVLHTLEDAEDMIWGDIVVARIHPQAFIYDPWSTDMDLQDGAYMGKAAWMDIEAFRKKYPSHRQYAVPGEWLSRVNQLIGSSDDLGTGPNLIPELWDQGTGRIRVLTMWYKVPTEIYLLVDERTGEFKEFKSKDAAAEHRDFIATSVGREAVAPLQIISTGSTAFIGDQTGQPVTNPGTGQPMEFVNQEMAGMAVNQIAQQVGLAAIEGAQVIKRTAKKPYWADMVYWTVLEHGESPFNDRKYPFVPYISRRWADDPESIFGVVRNLWDPQDEYNKRYSNLLAHVTSSSHSGWLNRKSGGANSQALELMGSKPGVVVEYSVQAPTQIQPTQLPPGHFAMIQLSEKNILRISSINAEMVGQTTQQTVSGRAIKARQAGGAVGLKPRFRTFEESLLDLGRMVFSRIQQFYPSEKIRQIIGIEEMSKPMGMGGLSIFADPTTGQLVNEDIILDFLERVKNTEFHLVFGLQDTSITERQATFEKAIQMTQLYTASGRPIGSATLLALIDLSDLPSKLSMAMKLDAMVPPMMSPAQPKGQPGQGKDKPANGDGASSGGGGGGSTAGKQQAAASRPTPAGNSPTM